MDALPLIELGAAVAYDDELRQATAAAAASAGISPVEPVAPHGQTATGQTTSSRASGQNQGTSAPTRFYATAELDPVTASLRFSKIMSELVELFSANPDTSVRIRIDIEAEDTRGFSEGTVRAAKENGTVLGVKSEFD